MAFSADGQRILTGSEDQTAKMWEADTGKELLTLNGHSGEVFSVAFSPDGQRILTSSGNGTAKVWDAATGKELLTLSGHNSPVSSSPFPGRPANSYWQFCWDCQRVGGGQW